METTPPDEHRTATPPRSLGRRVALNVVRVALTAVLLVLVSLTTLVVLFVHSFGAGTRDPALAVLAEIVLLAGSMLAFLAIWVRWDRLRARSVLLVAVAAGAVAASSLIVGFYQSTLRIDPRIEMRQVLDDATARTGWSMVEESSGSPDRIADGPSFWRVCRTFTGTVSPETISQVRDSLSDHGYPLGSPGGQYPQCSYLHQSSATSVYVCVQEY